MATKMARITKYFTLSVPSPLESKLFTRPANERELRIHSGHGKSGKRSCPSGAFSGGKQ
jgi:hypothetical protein